jgi:hypothetical protein
MKPTEIRLPGRPDDAATSGISSIPAPRAPPEYGLIAATGYYTKILPDAADFGICCNIYYSIIKVSGVI